MEGRRTPSPPKSIGLFARAWLPLPSTPTRPSRRAAASARDRRSHGE
jgi:hypothetical protein